MQGKEIKKWLIDHDLTIAQMSRRLEPKMPNATQLSIAQMLSDLFNQRAWYPTLAEHCRTEFGLAVSRPRHFEPVRRRKLAA